MLRGHRIVVPAITWSEISFAARAVTHLLAEAFCARLDAILPLGRTAVDATTEMFVLLNRAGRS
ncbi:hypothetical protein DW184_24605 [Enterobacter cloacae]|nr:hypothetical protein DW184_24605 [Enterobacter cloacae]